MLGIKTGIIVMYVAMTAAVIALPLTLIANISLGVLVLLAVVHLYECYLYRELIRHSPGTVLSNTLGVFVFGVFHMVAMKDARRAAIAGIQVHPGEDALAALATLDVGGNTVATSHSVKTLESSS